MKSLSAQVAAIKPKNVIAYIDVVAGLVMSPATEGELRFLREHCASLKIERHGQIIRTKNGQCRQINIWPRTERWQLSQPSFDAIEFLSTRRDFHLNYVEHALDLLFEDLNATHAAHETMTQAFIVKNRRRHVLQFYSGSSGATFYSSGRIPGNYDTKNRSRRKASNVVAIYSDRSSKLSGHRFCLHFCWRTFQALALKRIGLRSVEDLLSFDFQKFWRDRLLLRDIDMERLGRCYRRWIDGRNNRLCDLPPAKRRSQLTFTNMTSGSHYVRNDDLSGGSILKRFHGYTADHRIVRENDSVNDEIVQSQFYTQNVIDGLRAQGLNITSSLIKIDVDHLLPTHEGCRVMCDHNHSRCSS